MKFVEKVKQTISKYQMLESGDRVIVGVSGGPDSMALLYVLNQVKEKYRLKLKIAHLNHGFRGGEARKEAGFVERMAQRLGLSCEVRAVDVPSYKREKLLSAQEAARIVRYQFLEEVRKQFRASKIALGHNANDQAETLMMWLLRGTGLKGLGGIPPVREGVIIRPLIETDREEIEAFIKEKKIPFVVDSSNLKTDYLRNRLRHEVFPLLQKHYNPQLIKTLVQTASLLRAEDEYLERVAQEVLKTIGIVREREAVSIDVTHLLKLPSAIQLRCLRAAQKKVKGNLRQIGSTHLYDILKIVANEKPHKVLKLPQGISVEKSYNNLIIGFHQSAPRPFYYHFTSIPDRVIIKEIGKEILFKVVKGNEKAINKNDFHIAWLDLDKLTFPLTIRNMKPGDRFQPLGMKGEKKIKDFFIDEKVPLLKRKCVPLLFFGDIMGWVGEMRINHRLRVKEDTKKILRVEIEKY